MIKIKPITRTQVRAPAIPRGLGAKLRAARQLFTDHQFAAAAVIFSQILERDKHNVEIYCYYVLSELQSLPLELGQKRLAQRIPRAIARVNLRLEVIRFFRAPQHRLLLASKTGQELSAQHPEIYRTFTRRFSRPEGVFEDWASVKATVNPQAHSRAAARVIETIRSDVEYFTGGQLQLLPPGANLPPSPPAPAEPRMPQAIPLPAPDPEPLPVPATTKPAPPPISPKKQKKLNSAARAIIAEFEQQGLSLTRIAILTEQHPATIKAIKEKAIDVSPELLTKMDLALNKEKQLSPAPSPAYIPRQTIALPSATDPTRVTRNPGQQLLSDLNRQGLDEAAIASKTGLTPLFLRSIRMGSVVASSSIIERLRTLKPQDST